MDMKRDDGTSYELSSNQIRKLDLEVVEGTCIFTSETRTVKCRLVCYRRRYLQLRWTSCNVSTYCRIYYLIACAS